jgi:adenylosuccinate synthase
VPGNAIGTGNFLEDGRVPGTCIIGLQWGDEAKGKIVDLLTRDHDIVVRYQGGANAGHTVVVGSEVYKLSLLPSGVLTPGVTCVIAGGVVLNPAKALEELDELASRKVEDYDNLKLSNRVHVIFPWHFAEDRAMDRNTSDGENIGTTGRGIGPCYRDKVGRSYAVRLGDMYRDTFRDQVRHITAEKNRLLKAMLPAEEFKELNADEIYEQYMAFAKRNICSPRQSRGSGSCLKALKVRSSMSITAPIRLSRAATAPASVFPTVPAFPANTSTRSSAS